MLRKAKKMTKEEYFRKEKELIGTSTVDFGGPVLIKEKGVEGYDLDGSKFLDFTGQISLANTGYNPKEVVSAVKQQAGKLLTCISCDYPFLTEIKLAKKIKEVSRVILAEKLIEITDKVMPFKKRVFFEDSGATAVDLAAKIAIITHLRSKEIKTEDFNALFEKEVFIPSREEICRFSFLVFRNAFHGRHGFAHLFTNSKPKQMWAVSSSCAVGRLPFPIANSNFNLRQWLLDRDEVMKKLLKFAPIVAFIFEPVQGEGGINVPDEKILRDTIDYFRYQNINIITDEVQTGLGRTGKMWACEHFGIEPDMLITSKSFSAGIGGVSAVVVNAEKFPDLEPGMHSGSHHATPLAVAGAIANIDLILKENLAERSLCYGEYTLRRLKEIAKQYPVITDVRGLGLMIGIEFQNVEIRDRVAKNCKERGLLLAPCGQKAIRMTPPLIVTIPEIDKALDIFQNALFVETVVNLRK